MSTPTEMGTNLELWAGTVVDVQDPEELGRVKVRIVGLYIDDEALVPSDTLPWAIVSMPANSASHDGIGMSPTGLEKGSSVWGFFLDGASKQQPLVCGTWYGKPKGKSDVSEYATGKKKAKKGTIPNEPADKARPQYPHNKTITTKSGHLIELDDTPGAERINVYHKSGTYFEIGNNGDQVLAVKGNGYDLAVGNKTMYVGGNLNITVKGTANISAKSVTISEG